MDKVPVLRYQTIEVEGFSIPCALGDTEALHIYIPIAATCRIFGIDPDAQVRRIREDEMLAQGLVRIDMPDDPNEPKSQKREVNAISLTRFHAWLMGISINALNASDEIKEHLAAFRTQAADLIYAFFGRAVEPTDIQAEREQRQPIATRQFYAAVDQARRAQEEVEALKNRVAALEDEVHGLRITIKDADDEEIINDSQAWYVRKWAELIGDRLEKRGEGTYATVYNALKDRYHFPKYRLMKKKHFSDARKYCTDWYKRLVPPGSPPPKAFTDPEQPNLF